MDIENVVNATQAEVVEPQGEQAVEAVEAAEVSTQSEEKPKQSADDNAKYAAARRESEKKAKELEAKLKRLEEAAKKGGFENIDVFAETYEQQLKAEEIRKKKERFEAQGIDYDMYEELVQNDPRIKQASEFEKIQSEQARQQKEINDFFDYFEKANGRSYDAKVDKISNDVEEMVKNGVPLTVAYRAIDESTKLKAELQQLRDQLEARHTNEANAVSSPGRIDGTGSQDSDHISFEQFNDNKSNPAWMKKNLDKILKSRPKW